MLNQTYRQFFTLFFLMMSVVVFGQSATAVEDSPVTCFGGADGAATVTAIGGTSPYTYSWDQSTSTSASATDLVAGLHTITVFDALGVQFSTTINITEATEIIATIVMDSAVSCNGGSDGSATITTNGGTPPYSYSWDKSTSTIPIATDLAAGYHTIIITDANNCEKTVFITITEPDELDVQASELSPVICNGENNGQAEVTVVGGTTPYSYSWDMSPSTNAIATDLIAGIHTITVTDANACAKITTVTITEPLELSTTGIEVSPVKCFGGNDGVAMVTATGGTIPYTYAWDMSTSTTETASDLVAGVHTVTITDANNCITNVLVTITEPLIELTAIVIPDNQVMCNGQNDGAATVTVSGGTAPYTYSWDKSTSTSVSPSDLEAGIHTVTVTDANNCMTTASVTITEPIILTATASENSSVVCNGEFNGSAIVVANGGTFPYTYSWDKSSSTNDTATDLEAGIHTIIVKDANDCEATVFVTITEPNILLVVVSENIPITCNGLLDGSATVLVSGGITPYTYTWENSMSVSATADDLGAGNHTVTILDANDCEATVNVVITEPNLLAATAVEDSGVTCFGGSDGVATVTVNGGTLPYTFSWDKSTATTALAADLDAGIHTITIKDANDCETTTTVTITEPLELVATAIEDSPVKCVGAFNGEATVTVNGGTAPYIYSWDKSISTSASANDLEVGFHTITIRDLNGCETIATVVITDLNALSATAVQFSRVTCNGLSDGSAVVTIVGGTSPFTYTWDKSTSTSASASDLAAGVHTIKVEDANNCEILVSVLIEEPAILTAFAAQVSPAKCKGESSGEATVITEGGTMPYSYAWDKSVSNSSTATDLEVGLHTITITDAMNCVTTAIVEISEPDALEIIETIQPILCNTGGSISVQVTGGISSNLFYTWTGPSSFSQSGFDLKLIANLFIGGNYTLSVIDDNGCEVSELYSLDTFEQIDYTGQTTFDVDTCDSFLSISINDFDVRGGTPFIDGSGNPYYNYEWFGPDNFHAFGASIPVEPGTYQLIIIDGENCESNPIIITVNPIYDPIVVNEEIGDVTCDEESDGFIAIDVSGGRKPYTIVWELENPSSGSGNPTYSVIGNDLLRINDLEEGRYRLTVTSDIFPCANENPSYIFQTIYTVSSAQSITVLEEPIIDNELCLGNPGTITVRVVDTKLGPISFIYNGALVTPKELDDDYYELFIASPVDSALLNIVNDEGCGEEFPIEIGVIDPLFVYESVGFNSNGIVSLNEEVTFINTATGDPFYLEWDFGDGSPTDDSAQPTHSYQVTGLYDVILRFYNEQDCFKEYILTIEVGGKYSVKIPDVFTPNNDGINDYFQFEFAGITNFSMEIYDLWNNLLYAEEFTAGSLGGSWGWNGKLSTGEPFTGKIFKYVFKGVDNSGEEVIISNQALLLR